MTRIATFFIAIALIFTTVTADAQSNIKTGAKGGLNFASFIGSDTDYQTRSAFTIGGFLKFDIPDSPIAIQPELLYSQMGAKLGDNEIRMDYLQLPVVVKYTMTPAAAVQPNIFGGLYASMRLRAEQEGSTGGFPIGGGSSNISNQTESVDYGAVFGVGVDIEVASSIFTTDIRYNFGLSDVFTSGDGRNGVLAVTIGVSIPDMQRD